MNIPEDITGTGNDARDDVLRRIEALRTNLAEQSNAARKRHVGMLVIMGALACVTTFGLSQVNTLAHGLDATTLARIGGQQAAENLSQGRVALEEALAAKAPDIVGQAFEATMNSLPSVRAIMVEQIHDNLDAVNDEFVNATVGQLQRGMYQAKLAIDRSDPDASDKEKMMIVAKTAMKDFERDFDQALDELYPTYASQMSQMTEYLQYLSKGDGSQLDAKDRSKREIIETVMQLIVRFRDGNGY